MWYDWYYQLLRPKEKHMTAQPQPGHGPRWLFVESYAYSRPDAARRHAATLPGGRAVLNYVTEKWDVVVNATDALEQHMRRFDEDMLTNSGELNQPATECVERLAVAVLAAVSTPAPVLQYDSESLR
jgi:hypothetical protein